MNRKALNEVQVPGLSTEQVLESLRPFREFETLSVDEKRRLITTRFQGIRVRDYRVQSLFLLTGDGAESSQRVESYTTVCRRCGDKLTESREVYRGGYCERCSDGAAPERRPGGGLPVQAGGLNRESSRSTVNDSYQRL